MLLSICYLFIYYSLLYDDLGGIISSIVLLVVGAAETAVGLTIIMYIP
jgi:NADH:ubiquinone oxidoreductase subunit K